jgi:hypothetical protein
MNIAIHCEQFDGRGSGKAPLDYGIALKSILGHNISFITSNKSKNEGITWSGRGNPNYDKCHIELLDGKALLYNDGHDLVDILSNLNRKELKNNKWDTYSTKFDDVSVMNQYNNTFLNNNQ